MIIFSPDLFLAASPELNTPVFGWNSILTQAALQATSAAIDHPVSNLLNPSTALYWEAAPGSPADDQYLTAIIASVDPIDYVAVAGHNWGSAHIPVSIEIALEQAGSPLDYVWTELIPDHVIGSDEPRLYRFAEVSPLALRVRLQPGDAVPNAAVLHVGKLLVMPRGISDAHVPINLGRTVDKSRQVSNDGHYLGDVILSEGRVSSLPFKHLDPGWYRDTMDEFVVYAHTRGRPFFVAWQPVTYPRDVGYCSLTNNPQPIEDFDTQTVAIEIQMEGAAI